MGDYDPIEHGPSVDYLRDFDFAPSQSDDLLEKIMEIHRTTLKGQAPAEAGQLGTLSIVGSRSAVQLGGPEWVCAEKVPPRLRRESRV